ncbi:MAG: phosphodiester glycosidase family protein [Deltaproteobacteria bacterium]|nr:phosphodiester glycosidase family protein [Deltaproteobacteria bacterium]
MHLRRVALVASCILVVWSSSGASVRADDVWSAPYPGVRYLERTTDVPWRLFAAVVDLCESGVRVRATTPSEGGRVVSSFAEETGVEVAINGDFFDGTFQTRGLAVGDGFRWPGTADSSSWGLVAFGEGRSLVSPEDELLEPAPEWITEAIGGVPSYVAHEGVAVESYSRSFCDVRHPRTAVGLSRDLRTAFLVAVDGRSAQSAGMTCLELGAAMVELGAHDAINLDGGGSTTMWLRDVGVVNVPSDGDERRVANHLGVFATGLGAPYSCNHAVDDALLAASLLDEDRSTDLDGDGLADVCARDGDGVRCVLARGDGFGVEVPGPPLSDAAGWAAEARFTSLRMGDIDGDGAADLCAIDGARILCWPSNGSSFADPIVGPELSPDATHEQASTFRVADVTGDGLDDVCVRTRARYECHPSLGDAFGAAIAGPPLSDAEGWDEPSRYGTIRMADLDGDGAADVCARHGGGMACWLAVGGGRPWRAIEGPPWSDADGWAQPSRWSTIRAEDVDGDGRADLCGRTATRFECHLSSGVGFGRIVAGPAWSDDAGWDAPSRYATIRLADVDGDGRRDACARGSDGVRCWLYRDDGFTREIVGPPLTDAAGWDEIGRYRTLRFADVSGDRRADLCARDADALSCWLSDGAAFSTRVFGPAWSDEAGWLARSRYATIRLAGGTCVSRAERCNALDDDCDGATDEGGVCDSGQDGGAPALDAGPGPVDGSMAPDAARTEAGASPPTIDPSSSGSCAVARHGSGGRASFLALALAFVPPLVVRSRRFRRPRRRA